MRAITALVVIVVLAGCGAASAKPAEQYQAAADRINAVSARVFPAMEAAGEDPARLAPLYREWADALRVFASDIDPITGPAEAAIDELVRATAAEEVLFRNASRASTYAEMQSAFVGYAAVNAASDAAVNLVRVKLGLPPAPP